MSAPQSTQTGRQIALAPAERSQPSSETEVATLLRQRMRLAFLLIAAYAVSIIARELTRGAIASQYAKSVVSGNILLGSVLCLFAALLWSSRRLTLPQLRRIELMGIGLAVVLTALSQHLWYMQARPWPGALLGQVGELSWSRNWFYLMASAPRTTNSMILSWADSSLVLGYSYCLNWVVGIFLYGVFFPNTLRRGCLVIGGIVSVPLLNLIVIALRSEPALRGWYLGPLLLQVAAILGIGAVTGVTATYKLTELRKAVAAIRRLGQYRLFERIGHGGMGEVYRGQHMFLRRPCAIKLIRDESQDGSGMARSIQRFEREVQATASLHHPNIVDVYDYGRAEDGTFFYVMEYLHGISLEQLVRRHGPLSPGRAIYLLRQACAALAEAHAVGLIHRDIKPSNLFVCSRGTQHDVVKLLDFGLVQQSDAAARTGDDTPPVVLAAVPSISLPPGAPAFPASFRTLAGSLLGTPSFMSPEQIRATVPLDGRSDLYSLGVVAYYLLVGHPPFRGVTNMDVMAAHLTMPPPAMASSVHGIPADLEALILRCLAKEPDDRPGSASELEAELARCQNAEHWNAAAAAAWWRASDKDRGPIASTSLTPTESADSGANPSPPTATATADVPPAEAATETER